MTQKYFDDWSTQPADRFDDGLRGFDAMIEDFEAVDESIEDKDVLFAAYGRQSYDGYAFVLFQRDGRLYEVHASHCSCMGLEGQWKPEETTWAEVTTRDSIFSDETNAALAELVAAHTEGR